MRAEPMTTKVEAAIRRQRGDWDARRVRRDHAAWTPSGLHTCEDRALGVDLLHDGFNDPVGLTESLEIPVEPDSLNQTRGVPGEEGV